MLRGQFSVPFLEGEEDLVPVTPQLRNLNLPGYALALVKENLISYSLPPAALSHPEGTNRSTLADAIRSYTPIFEEMQGKIGEIWLFLFDWLASLHLGRPVRNVARFVFPPVFVQTPEEIALQSTQVVNSVFAQESLLLLAYDRGLIDMEQYSSVMKRLLTETFVDLDEEELSDATNCLLYTSPSPRD